MSTFLDGPQYKRLTISQLLLIMFYAFLCFRSFYNPLTTKYSGYKMFSSHDSSFRGLGVDFNASKVYVGYWADDNLYVLDLKAEIYFRVYDSSNVPRSISADPYNR